MGKKAVIAGKNLTSKMGKILFHSNLKVLPQLLLQIKKKRFVYIFSPMCYFEQCSYVM